MGLGSGRNSSPARTGAMSSVFQAVRNIAFSGIAFGRALGDDLFNLVAYFGLCWGTHRHHFGHHWAVIWRRNFPLILGVRDARQNAYLEDFPYKPHRLGQTRVLFASCSVSRNCFVLDTTKFRRNFREICLNFALKKRARGQRRSP